MEGWNVICWKMRKLLIFSSAFYTTTTPPATIRHYCFGGTFSTSEQDTHFYYIGPFSSNLGEGEGGGGENGVTHVISRYFLTGWKRTKQRYFWEWPTFPLFGEETILFVRSEPVTLNSHLGLNFHGRCFGVMNRAGSNEYVRWLFAFEKCLSFTSNCLVDQMRSIGQAVDGLHFPNRSTMIWISFALRTTR